MCAYVRNDDKKDRIVCVKCHWLVRELEGRAQTFGILFWRDAGARQVHADCEFGPRAIGKLPANFAFTCWQCQLSARVDGQQPILDRLMLGSRSVLRRTCELCDMQALELETQAGQHLFEYVPKPSCVLICRDARMPCAWAQRQ